MNVCTSSEMLAILSSAKKHLLIVCTSDGWVQHSFLGQYE